MCKRSKRSKTLRLASALGILGVAAFGWIAACDVGNGDTIPGVDAATNGSDAPPSPPDAKEGGKEGAPPEAGDAGVSSDGDASNVAFTYVLIDDMETTTKGPIQLSGINPPLNPGYWFNFGVKVPPPGDTFTPALMSFVFTALPSPTTTFKGKMSMHAAHQVCSLNGLYDVCGLGLEFAQVPDLDAGPPDAADAGDAARADAAPMDAGSDGGDGAPPILMTTVPFDISQYKGIAFWAKAATDDAGAGDAGDAGGADGAAGLFDLKVAFPDTDTDPRGGVCNSAMAGASGPTDDSQCYNSYSVHKMLTSDWQQFTVLFTDLGLESFGYPTPGPWDGKKVYGIDWQSQKNSLPDAGAETFDFWVDDVYFLQ